MRKIMEGRRAIVTGGGSAAARLERTSDTDMAATFALNYWSVLWAMQTAFPIMQAQNYGRIINMGSLNGVNAHMFTVAYNASKEAMRALSRTEAMRALSRTAAVE